MIPHEYFEKVKKHFNGNEKKTWEWFQNIHPRFGMFSPLNAIKLGKVGRVKNFIDKELKNYY